MPLPTSINDLSTTPASNFPAGTEAPDVLDNVIREHAAYIAQLRDGKLSSADLASTAAGKGDEMVATDEHTFTTLAQALAEIDWAWQQYPHGVHFLRYVPVAEWSKIADGTSTDDLSSYLVTAFNAVRDAGGGTLILPEGSFYVSTATLQWTPTTSNVSVNIKGAGTKATTIRKHGTSTSPVLNLTVSAVGNGVYSTLADFQVSGISTCNAITATLLARLQTRNLRLVSSSVGLDAVGTLICDHYNIALESNAIGFRCRASGSYYPNLVQFFGGVLLNNTTTGADIGEAQNVFFHGTDVEFNGTAGNTSTAGIIVRSTCGTVSQHSNIAFNGAWFESNTGAAQLLVEDATYLALAMRDVPFNINPSNKAMTVGAIRSLVIDSCSNNSSGSEYNIGAVQGFTLRGGTCATVNNSAVHWIYENVIINGSLVQYRRGGASLGTLNARADRQNSGTSNVSAPTSGSPVTLFTVSGSGPRMILVFACLGGAGASYTANARFAWDGTNLVRMGGENAANMTLTASGANVQATQSSGVSQTIFYISHVIGT